MPPRTVRVPSEFAPLFEQAEEVVSRFFAARRDDPAQGTIEICGERYVLVRAAALSVEFFDLVRGLYGPGRHGDADAFASNILYDLAHAVGRSDARNFHAKMLLDDPLARLSAGPVHFAHAGWAQVDILPDSRPSPGQDCFLSYVHPTSFECDAWRSAARTAPFPVCIMNAGYSSGWCSESFGVELVAVEVECRAHGGERCAFVMATPGRIEEHVAQHRAARPRGPGVEAAQIPDFFSRKRVEEELRRRFAEELRDREAAEARLRAATKLEAVGRLAGGIAHDFNNLMAVVLARASLLSARLPADDPMRAEVDKIAEAGERASALTRQLLAFSRAQVVAREPLDADAVIAGLLQLVAPVLGEHIELAPSLRAPGAALLFDRSQLEQIVTNLLVNARDAMPRGGVVSVSTRVTPRAPGSVPWLELSVRDDGEGMDEQTMAHMFEPYFTTRVGQGTGLGLATVHGIVRQAGGVIEVTSTKGRGATFTVRLPLHAGAAATPSSAPPPRDAPARLRVLLVEDDPLVRDAVELLLGSLGHEARAFGDPVAASELADARLAEVDVLLTDVVMPRRGGREVALALRQRRPDLPVIFMSGYPPDPEALASVARARFVAKPFRGDELALALLELVGRR